MLVTVSVYPMINDPRNALRTKNNNYLFLSAFSPYCSPVIISLLSNSPHG